ncbi:hypothetical protein BDA99DRAFT_506264 [Phascolomyces articulosus]|uniref:CS domain-containing protein n=1 Tax=Phascolomyces articulosus TaxID=60185 RepID=A0AAD5KC34_9FUNG|nr:hypothetical protein BDA99DRAFT_506264 [Phascolomyces articulosus]
MTCNMNYDQADIAELKRLKALTTRPVVIATMEKLLEDAQQEHQNQRLSNASISSSTATSTATNVTIREPISRTKANTQTVYITSNYSWSETDKSVFIYLTIKNATEIRREQYHLQVKPRAVQLDISEHEGANYNFRISQLQGQVTPEQSSVKVKENNGQVLISLRKGNVGVKWGQLRLKTTRDMYDQLQRDERNSANASNSNQRDSGSSINQPLASNNSTLFDNNTTMETIVREAYQSTDSDTRKIFQESWKHNHNYNNNNPFDVSSILEDHKHPSSPHHHHSSS